MSNNALNSKHSGMDDVYASLELSKSLPKTKFPLKEQAPRNVFSAVRDELMLDGNSRQNLGHVFNPVNSL